MFDVRDAFADSRAIEVAPEPLTLDTSRITNPRVREQVEDVVHRLEGSFDTMLSRIVPGGIFVALEEFVGPHSDGAAVVRAAHEAGLLAIDASTASRRVSTERIEGTDVAGIILSAEAFRGHSDWVARGQEGARKSPDALGD
ncbi:hypothetical protein BURC_03416 [Burkholderiaceae bacterium]|nr:hypothetical protein BURC_03416 [Burkholderiaceae bacterium]